MRSIAVIAVIAGLAFAAGLLASSAFAASFFRTIGNKVVAKECGACHMPYPAMLLPARSWAKIIGALDKHFGEDASMPEASRQQILAFMSANAGDSASSDSWFMRGVPNTATPVRITDMPFWRSIHGGFPGGAFKRADVRKKGNCLGCHG